MDPVQACTDRTLLAVHLSAIYEVYLMSLVVAINSLRTFRQT